MNRRAAAVAALCGGRARDVERRVRVSARVWTTRSRWVARPDGDDARDVDFVRIGLRDEYATERAGPIALSVFETPSGGRTLPPATRAEPKKLSWTRTRGRLAARSSCSLSLSLSLSIGTIARTTRTPGVLGADAAPRDPPLTHAPV